MQRLKRKIRRIAAAAMAVLVVGSTIPVHAVSMTGEEDTALSGMESTVSSGDAEEITSSVSGNGEDVLHEDTNGTENEEQGNMGISMFSVNENGGCIDIGDVDAGGSSGQIEINAGNVSDWDGKTLTGNTTDKSLIINGVTLRLTIKDLSIDRSSLSSTWLSAIGITGGGSLYLTLEGTNYLHGATGGAGIWVNSGATLEITAESTGAVTAIGGNGYGGAAGIGAYASGMFFAQAPTAKYAGTIRIAGGNVTAQGGSYTDYGSTRPCSGGAGIGGTYGPSGAVIEITGGVVNAQGGYMAAGIGGGFAGSASEITISGGTVTAAIYETNGAMGAAIGNGIHSIARTAYPFGKIMISGGDVTAKGNVGFGSGKGEAYPDDGGTVTIAEGVYPKITGEVNYGKNTAEGIVKYHFGFTVYDGRFTADTAAKVSLDGKLVGEAVEAKVNTPGKAGVAFSIACGELAGAKTFTLMVDGREYSANVDFRTGTTDYSPVIGTQLYPVVLQIYDDAITADVEVAGVIVRQGGEELSRENGDYYAPDKISRVSDTYGEMLCYLPAGADTEISVTATALNEGNAMEQTGYTVSASDNNRLCLKNREGLSLSAALSSVDVTSAKIKLTLNKEGAETTIYYKASDTMLSAEEIQNNPEGSLTINGVEGEVTLSGLKAYSENTYYFVAEQGGALSMVASLTFRTKRVAVLEDSIIKVINYRDTAKVYIVDLYVKTNAPGATVYYLKSTGDDKITDWQDVKDSVDKIVEENGKNTKDAGQKVLGETNFRADFSLYPCDAATEFTYYFVAKKDDCYSDVVKYTFTTPSSVVVIKPGETQEIPCKSFADAVATAKENPGSTVKLIEEQKNIQDVINVEEGNDFTLDLNGNGLHFTERNPICVNGGSLKVKGGRLSSSLDMSTYASFGDAFFYVTGGELSVSGTTLGCYAVPYCRINGEDVVVNFQNVTFQCTKSGGGTISLNVQQAKSLAFNNVAFNGTLRINNTPSVTFTGSTFSGNVLLDRGVLADDTFSGTLQLGTLTMNDYSVSTAEWTTGDDVSTLLQSGYVYQNSDSTTTAGTGSYSLSDVKIVPMTTLPGTLNVTGGGGEGGVPVFGDTLTAAFTPASGSTSGCTYTWYRVKGSGMTELGKGTSYTVQAEDVGASLRCVVVNGAKTGKLETTTETVAPKALTESNTSVTWNIYSYTYDGTEKKPEVMSVVFGGTTLTAGTDYTVTYTNNINAGTDTAKVEVTGIGAYQGSITKTFSIGQREVIVSGITAISRRYDGTTAAILAYSGVVIDGKLEDDFLTIKAVGSFADKNAGEGKTVNITGITLTGADAANYKLAADGQQTTATASIFALSAEIAEVPVLSGIYGTTVENMSVDGGKVVDKDDSSKVITGTWTVSDTQKTDIPKVGTTTKYELTFTPTGDFAGGYPQMKCSVVPVVAKKKIAVSIEDVQRKFGEQNPTLTYVIPTEELAAGDTENVIQVTLTTEAVKSSVVGQYPITGSAESDNYEVTFTGSMVTGGTLNVIKADTPILQAENRNYCYITGTGNGAVTLNVADKLPADRGTTTYEIGSSDADSILDGPVSVDSDGVLSYKVKGSTETDKIGKTADITVTAKMQNYENATYRLSLTITDRIAVEEQNGSEVTVIGNNVLTYGQILSELSLNEGGETKAVFVEVGTSKTVEGTLTWKNSNEIPLAGTTTAAWVFTPADSVHEPLEGTVAITVDKAKPAVSETPVVADRTYYPGAVLTDGDLTGGSVKHMIGGSETDVPGTWNWQSANIVPTADNNGYVAVFIPDDTANYTQVSKTIAVKVAKATPVITEKPSATEITYGDSLGKSALTGGTVIYSNSDDTAVAGAFSWKDAATRPVVADSNSREFTVIFAPTDNVNYEAVETQTTIQVRKAAAAPDMPGNTMNVSNGIKKVSEVSLPESWVWQDADKDTALEVGIAVNATAVYAGADKGNYETESVSIVITRSACDHKNTGVRNTKEADCGHGGYTGDTYCKDCGVNLTSGTETAALGHSYTSKVTKNPTVREDGEMTYTCSRCGHTYTEAIQKLQDNGTDNANRNTAGTDAANGSNADKDNASRNTADADTTNRNSSNRNTVNKDNADKNAANNSNGSNSGKPYIKNDNGKAGWELIAEQVKAAKTGETVTVEMNGTTTVPSDLFEHIKGSDINIVFDMGNGIEWTVNGKDVTDIKGDIDFGVTFGTEAGKTIPVDVISSITGEHTSMNLTLAYNGEFGFTAALTVNLEEANAGYYANLFYYNPDNSSLEFVCAGQIGKDGNVNLTFTHASDYTIVIAEIIMDEKNIDSIQNTDDKEPSEQDAEPASQDSNSEAAETYDSAWRSFWMIMLGSIVVVVGIGIFFINKKKKSE